MDSKNDFVPHSHFPYGKDGSGYYSYNATAYFKVMEEALPLVLEAIKSSHVKAGSVFTVVDYGTADGGTSMPLMYESVKAIREKYGEEMPINIIYEDQPINDFKSLFLRLQGLIPGPRSYLKDFQNVFVLACGTNYYRQCVPSNTVHLGFSATSMHWLSEKPCDITGALVHTMITDQEEKEKFAKQAERDWELILLKRADELAPGARAILTPYAYDTETGHYTGRDKDSKVSDDHLMTALWEQLWHEGTITEEEFKHTTFAMYYRTVEELKKPFQDPNSRVRRKGLELISIEIRDFQCPLKKTWLEQKGDPREYAKTYISNNRHWCNSTFLSGLSDSRSAQEKADIVDELFHRYESLVAENPEDYGIDFVNAYVVMQKRR